MIIRFLRDFWSGISSYYHAILFIFTHWIWIFYIIPVALTFSIFYSGEYILDQLRVIDISSELQQIEFQKQLNHISFEGFPSDSDEMQLLIYGAKLTYVVVALKLSKYLVLIFMAPVMAYVSARTERILTGNSYPFHFQKFISDIYRGVNFALRNLFRQIVIMIFWYGLTLIVPVLEEFTYAFLFLVSAYYYGASMMDYTSERRRLSMEESIRFIKRNAGIALATGIVFNMLFFVSFIGAMLAPVTGVVATTLAIHKKFDLSTARLSARKYKK